MKKELRGGFALFLSFAMVAGVVTPLALNSKETKSAKTGTELKHYNVSEKKLDKITAIAKNDGEKAAKIANRYSGNDFEAAVNKILTSYYKEENSEELKDFEKSVKKEANTIVENYKEAAIERENEESLSYEPNVSILTFSKEISQTEIKKVVEDQYGEYEYIHVCPDGSYMVKVNSIGLTAEKSAEAYDGYTQTNTSEINGKVEQIAEAWDMVNDEYRYYEYYLGAMKVGDAWNYIRGRNHSKIKVAVIDGGADINSIDLQFSRNSSVSVEENGNVIPLANASEMYNNSHGTGVAGVVAAQCNNGVQTAGVASCVDNSVVDLMNIRIDMFVDKIAIAVDVALNHGAKVVNLSLFHEGSFNYEEDAINRFTNAGGTVVAGAGNNWGDVKGFPSDYANTISVMSVDSNYARAGSSNFGWEKDICAPGVAIRTTGFGGNFQDLSGTSLASPMVAGVVAMMYSVNTGLNFSRVKEIIVNTARDLGDGGRDYYYGYGFIQASAAVQMAGGGGQVTTTKAPETQPQNDGPTEVFGYSISSPRDGIINVVWGNPNNGQTFNVYVDGNIKLREVACASYDIEAQPGKHIVKITGVKNGKETSGVTAEVNVGGQVVTTAPPTTAPANSGYTYAGAGWNELNYWSAYQASGWGNDPVIEYKSGNSYNDMSVIVDKASGADWGIQLKTKEIAVQSGKSYTCTITVNSNMAADNLLIKDEKSGAQKTFALVNGNNTITLDFTSLDVVQIFFNLGFAPQGLKYTITSFNLKNNEEVTTPEPTTEAPTTRIFDAYNRIEAEDFSSKVGGVVDTNSNASNGKNIGGVTNNVSLTFDQVHFSENSGALCLNYSSKSGDASGYVEVYVDNNSNAVGTIELPNTADNWSSYVNITGKLNGEISGGTHKVTLKFITTNNKGYVANIDYFSFVKSSEVETDEPTTEEPTTEEPTTEEPTTEEPTTENTDNKYKIFIDGCQISASAKGLRTVYTVNDVIDGKQVVSSGIIYSLENVAPESELYVGSTHSFVRCFESTQNGIIRYVNWPGALSGKTYAMTMLFATDNPLEYTDMWRIRAYAKLSDGTYVYTDTVEYSFMSIAESLYTSCQMPNEAGHEYLYNNILKIVNPDYIKLEYMHVG